MNPPTCRFCKVAAWNHRCGLGSLTGKVTAPTTTPKTIAKAKFKAKKGKK